MSFRLLGFPVEIQNGAWFLAGIVFLMGLSRAVSVPYLLGVIAIGAVSILVHELGHATVARAFGLRPVRIALHGFGGATTHPWSGSNWKELGITLAGPGFGFGLALVSSAALLLPLPEIARDLVWLAVTLNVAWSVFNLLPIYPMDGGRALGFALAGVLPPAPSWFAVHGLGVVLGAGLAIGAMSMGEVFIAMFGGLFAWQNVQAIGALRARVKAAKGGRAA